MQNAANCITIRICYIVQLGEGKLGKLTAHAHVLMHDPLPVGQAACRARRQWNRQRMFVFVETVLTSECFKAPGLDCPGVSLVEVCATCLRCHLW